ncbi:MAG TPA: flagellar hook-length control protein FliK [Fimbriimonadaceae bacterium]|nr:flagellar hook-length control protein FliK [Fimbriimonadaceae bacterium]
MQITANLFGVAVPEASVQAEGAVAGFRQMLEAAEGGKAPPGPQPPPAIDQRVQEEAVSLKPNAQPQKPDSPPLETAIQRDPLVLGGEPAVEVKPSEDPLEGLPPIWTVTSGSGFFQAEAAKASAPQDRLDTKASEHGPSEKVGNCIFDEKRIKEWFVREKPKPGRIDRHGGQDDQGLPKRIYILPVAADVASSSQPPTHGVHVGPDAKFSTEHSPTQLDEALFAQQMEDLQGVVTRVERDPALRSVAAAAQATAEGDRPLGKKQIAEGRFRTKLEQSELRSKLDAQAKIDISALEDKEAAAHPDRVQPKKEVLGKEAAARASAKPEEKVKETLPEDKLQKVDLEAPPVREAAPKGKPVEVHASTPAEAVQTLGRKDAMNIVRQVIDRLEMLVAARPKAGITIHLDPKDFGSITMVVKTLGDSVDARIYASNDQVRHALEQGRVHLGQAMENRGYSLNSVTVSSQAQMNAGSDFRHAPQHQPQPQSHQAFAKQWDSSPDNRGFAALSARARLGGMTAGVDLWI